MPGWAEAKKAVDAYRAGDLVTATSRAHMVRDTWGQSWAELSDALWAIHTEPEPGVRRAPKKPEGKLRRWLRGVGDLMGALGDALTCLEVAIVVVVVVLAIGLSLFDCIRNALP
jgi:hypothetical protein